MFKSKKFFFHTITFYVFIKLFATCFTLFVFNKFTPTVDSFNYIDGYYLTHLSYFYELESNTFLNFFNHFSHLRTLCIQLITTGLLNLTNPFITHYIFSLFSSLGILFYCLRNKDKKLILILLLFPSMFIWTSIVGKEAIFVGLLSLIFLIWIDFINNNFGIYKLLFLILLFLFCFILRPHFTFCFLWLISISFLIKVEFSKNFFRYLFISFIVFILLSVLNFHMYVQFFKYISEGILQFFENGNNLSPVFSNDFGYIIFYYFETAYRAIDSEARASRNNILEIYNYFHLSKNYFLGIIFGIIGPLPNELNRIEFIPFFIEGIIILLFPIVMFFLIYKERLVNKKYYYYYILAVLPTILILMMVHAPFGILNPGTAIRWRVNFELTFYMIPFLIYLEQKNLKTNQNKKLE